MSKTCTSEPGSTAGPETLGDTRKETTPEVRNLGVGRCRERPTEDFQENEDTLDSDGDSDFIPKGMDAKQRIGLNLHHVTMSYG